MSWGTGLEYATVASVSSGGTAVTFSTTATLIPFRNVFILNNGSTNVYVSITSTSGTSGGYLLAATESRTFQARNGRYGGYVGISFMTLAAVTSGSVKVHAWS